MRIFCFCSATVPQSYGFEVKRMELLQDRDYSPAVMRLINGAQHSVRVCMFQAVFYPGSSDSPSNQILHGAHSGP